MNDFLIAEEYELTGVNLASYLNEDIALEDMMIFADYVRGRIDLDTAIEEFRENNDIPDEVEIGKLDFALWIGSLGWY